MSGLNKIFHKSMWLLEHMEKPRSSCGRSGRSWSHGTESLDNQCWHKASQAAGGAGETLCMHFSGLSQDCWHDKHSSLFQPSFDVLYFFLQGTVSLTSLPSVMIQVQLKFPSVLEKPRNLEIFFFWFCGDLMNFSLILANLYERQIVTPGQVVSPFPTLDRNIFFWCLSLWLTRSVHGLLQFTGSLIVHKEPAAIISAMWGFLEIIALKLLHPFPNISTSQSCPSVLLVEMCSN